MKKKRSFWPLLIATTIILIVLRIVFYFFNQDDLIKFLSVFYGQYGPLILFVSGIIEAIVLVGLYYPGSTIILLGATLAGAKIISLPEVILWSSLGLIIGYIIDYYFGLKGGEKLLVNSGLYEPLQKARDQAEKSKLIYLWSTVHPNIAAVAATVLGSMKVNFTNFLMLITLSQFFWSTFWGLIFYFFGMILLGKIAIFVGIIITILFVLEIIKIFLPKHKLF